RRPRAAGRGGRRGGARGRGSSGRGRRASRGGWVASLLPPGSGPTSCRKVSETSVGVVKLTSRTPGGQAVAHQAPRRTRLTCTDGRHEEIRGRGATVLRGAGNFRGRA